MAEGVVNEGYPACEVRAEGDRYPRTTFQGSLYPHLRQVRSQESPPPAPGAQERPLPGSRYILDRSGRGIWAWGFSEGEFEFNQSPIRA